MSASAVLWASQIPCKSGSPSDVLGGLYDCSPLDTAAANPSDSEIATNVVIIRFIQYTSDSSAPLELCSGNPRHRKGICWTLPNVLRKRERYPCRRGL